MQVFQVDFDESLEPFDFEREQLAAAGIEVVSGRCTSADELVERAKDARVLWLAWKPGVDRAVMEQLPNLELVIRWGVGYDQIDVAAATELGVAVANAPDYGTIDVAEHVIALLLSGSRRVPWYHEAMKAGGWPDPDPGVHHRVSGRTLGLVGLGRIGAAVARRARGLDLNVVGLRPGGLRRQADVAWRSRRRPRRAAGDRGLRVPPCALHAGHEAPDQRVDPERAQAGGGTHQRESRHGRRHRCTDRCTRQRSPRMGGSGRLRDRAPAADSPIRTTPGVILTPHLAGFSEEAWQDLREEMCLTTTQWARDGWADRVVNPEVRESLRSNPKD